MGQFCNWQSGMWVFPVIGCGIMMFMCFMMMIFSRRGFGGSCFRPWDYDRYTKENTGSESALEILNRRYAGGEITKEEYERIKRDILSKNP
jgi:putative membrane protein